MNIFKGHLILGSILAVSLLDPGSGWCNSKFLNVQGTLINASGNPFTSSNTVTFRLYTSSTAAVGSAVWTESFAVTFSTGVFNVTLGNVTSLDSIAFNQLYYLGIQVAGDANELSPRQVLGASAYAQGSLGNFNVGNTLLVSGTMTVTGNAFSVGGSTLVAMNGNVGVGTASPAFAFQVNGSSSAFGTSANVGSGNQAYLAVANGISGNSALGAPVDMGLWNQGGVVGTYSAQLGLGYFTGTAGQYFPGVLGARTTNVSGQSSVALFLATRNATSGTTAPTERLTVDSTGNVGIGTSAPAGKLQVQDGDIRITTTTGSRGVIFQDGTTQATAASNMGFVTLSATQTFSGANTFTSTVTVGPVISTNNVNSNFGVLMDAIQIVASTRPNAGNSMTFTNLQSTVTYTLYYELYGVASNFSPALRINNDSASNYDWHNSGFYNISGTFVNGAGPTTYLYLENQPASDNARYMFRGYVSFSSYVLYIPSWSSNTYYVVFQGQNTWIDSGLNWATNTMSGQYFGGSAISSIKLFDINNSSGNSFYGRAWLTQANHP